MSHRNERGGAQMSEFSLALMVFIVMLFPLLDMVGLGLGYCGVWFVAQQSVSRASKADSFPNAAADMQAEASSLNGTGVAKFLNLKPVGGYNGCGLDLYMDATAIGGNTTEYGPNSSYPPPADLTNNIYECRTRTHYEVSPWINMGGIYSSFTSSP